MVPVENRRFHPAPVVWSLKHENEGPYLSKYKSTLLMGYVQVKLSAVKVSSLFSKIYSFSETSFEYN